jgi:hypothetical protein
MRITWHGSGERVFEGGIDRGVLYVSGNPGVPWIGLINVNQGQSGGETKPRYLDGKKISNRASPEDFEATIEAYTYPLEFERCEGTYRGENGLRVTQQRRKSFGMSYRSLVGNDVTGGLSLGYKIHILYNLRAEPTDRGYRTLTDQSEPATFNWKITSRSADIPGYRPSSHFIIDTRDIPAELLQTLEDILYGNETTEPSLPTPGELIFLFDSFDDLVYDAGSPYTPVFATYDAGTPDTPVLETIDGGAL